MMFRPSPLFPATLPPAPPLPLPVPPVLAPPAPVYAPSTYTPAPYPRAGGSIVDSQAGNSITANMSTLASNIWNSSTVVSIRSMAAKGWTALVNFVKNFSASAQRALSTSS